MDIAGLSMNMAQSNIANSVSTAMLSKTLDSAEANGQSVVNMIESAKIPPAGTKGHIMDIRA